MKLSEDQRRRVEAAIEQTNKYKAVEQALPIEKQNTNYNDYLDSHIRQLEYLLLNDK
jgi:uncharacterized protein involved in tolerance to divalent cations